MAFTCWTRLIILDYLDWDYLILSKLTAAIFYIHNKWSASYGVFLMN